MSDGELATPKAVLEKEGIGAITQTLEERVMALMPPHMCHASSRRLAVGTSLVLVLVLPLVAYYGMKAGGEAAARGGVLGPPKDVGIVNAGGDFDQKLSACSQALRDFSFQEDHRVVLFTLKEADHLRAATEIHSLIRLQITDSSNLTIQAALGPRESPQSNHPWLFGFKNGTFASNDGGSDHWDMREGATEKICLMPTSDARHTYFFCVKFTRTENGDQLKWDTTPPSGKVKAHLSWKRAHVSPEETPTFEYLEYPLLRVRGINSANVVVTPMVIGDFYYLDNETPAGKGGCLLILEPSAPPRTVFGFAYIDGNSPENSDYSSQKNGPGNYVFKLKLPFSSGAPVILATSNTAGNYCTLGSNNASEFTVHVWNDAKPADGVVMFQAIGR